MALKECKECGNQVSSKAEACPGGGAPVKKETSLAAGCLGVFILAVVVVICAGALNTGNGSSSSGNRSSPSSTARKTWKDQDSSIMAYIMMEEFVKQRLRSPSTADFPGVFQGRADHVEYLGNQTYKIRSWVDAQNGFGATIRNNFVGEISQVDEQNWQLISLEIFER